MSNMTASPESPKSAHPRTSEAHDPGTKREARRRVLFIGEGSTLAHAARPLALAAALPSDRYDVTIATPEREMLQALIDKSQALVTGRVRIKLYKGHATVIGRESPYSLYDQDLVTFEEGKTAYDQRDAAGFIKLNALRLRVAANRDKKASRRK